jgi:hypothetical protein
MKLKHLGSVLTEERLDEIRVQLEQLLCKFQETGVVRTATKLL